MGINKMNYLLDTHVWIWWNMEPEKLSIRARALISNEDGENKLLLSSISPWEFCKLLEKRRI